MTTLLLVPGSQSASGFPELVRLGGGRQFPPSWVHSEHTLGEGDAATLLNARGTRFAAVRIVEVAGRGEQDAMAME